MPQRTFANQKALIDYAERNGLAYLWEETPAFYRRQRCYCLINTRLRRFALIVV
jgi:hypothetical protein